MTEKVLDDIIAQAEQILRNAPEDQNARRELALHFLNLADKLWCSPTDMVPSALQYPVRCWQIAMSLQPENTEDVFMDARWELAKALHFAGRQDECLAEVRAFLDLKERILQSHPLAGSGIRFLQTRTGILDHIGHLSSEPEFFLKMKEMGMVEGITPVLLVPGGKTANPILLDYWRDRLNVITDPGLCTRLQKTAKDLEYNSFWLKVPNGRNLHLHLAMIAFQKEWEDRGKGPVLKLKPEHRDRGWRFMREHGVEDGAWFAVFHIRQQPGNPENPPFWRYINCDVRTYFPAMEAVVERGGWVIRIGDSKMDPLPPMKGVIDLTHSEFGHGEMDLFAVAESKFMVATSSGPNGLPYPFGVPAVWTNICGVNIFPYSKNDLFLPKLIKSTKDNRMLSFDECYVPEFNLLFNAHVYHDLGVVPVDNTPEELRGAVVEMIDRMENKCVYSHDDEILQEKFRRFATRMEPHIMSCRAARDFLRNHADLLAAEPAVPWRTEERISDASGQSHQG